MSGLGLFDGLKEQLEGLKHQLAEIGRLREVLAEHAPAVVSAQRELAAEIRRLNDHFDVLRAGIRAGLAQSQPAG